MLDIFQLENIVIKFKAKNAFYVRTRYMTVKLNYYYE